MTDKEKDIVRKINDPVYTVDFLEKWIHRDDNVFTNAPAALQAMGAKGFYAANRDIRYDEKEKSYHCNNCGSRELGNNFTYCIGDYVFDKSENKVRLAIEGDNHRSDVEYIGRFLNLDEAMICYKNMNI